ncbi:sporulation protein [Corticibacter populi]|uniref:Sporulation protein n=1 Tax=Corticibacter populi TaxID=1550736 RepID=A0A3M6QQC2_9BURK|nr:SPOR domain-containing protein [Corticibacter populi]RMX05001.1 sporulation protein [Corticibacter populi]RZS33568.1 sporulation related protein [Corticibacter populi]
MKKKQRGGTIAGILIGLVIGLGIAIAVALVVSKMPVPFINTNAHTRPSSLDSTEDERNRNWNPNAALGGGNAGSGTPPRSVTPVDQPPVQPEPPSEVVAVAPESTPGSDPLGELAAQLGNRSAPATAAAPAVPPPAATDAYQYFVQAGAFRSQGDADSQRARLAMNGWDARITSREQQGQTVYRVRVGPFSKSEDAANLKRQLDQQGIDSAVVRQAR